MFDSLLAVPLHFTVEFLGFLVCAGGALLVTTRPNLVPAATSNRASVALGLLALAVAQVLHGGAFIQSDGDPLLIAVKSLAFALMLIGLVGGLRPGAAAVAAFQLREPLQLAPAAAALMVAAARASPAVIFKRWTAKAIANCALGAGEVPGLKSVPTATGTPASISRRARASRSSAR